MKVYWCNYCKTPLLNKQICSCGNKGKYISNDIRPVFPEERNLIFNLTHNNDFLNGHIWASKGSRYYIEGSCYSYSLDELSNNITNLPDYDNLPINKDLSNEYSKFNEEISSFLDENIQYLKTIQFSASSIVIDAVQNHQNSLPVVSFSGGKDSTVVSHLIRTSLSNPSIMHIFGDTKLEFPMTYDYIERFRKDNPRTPFLSSRSELDFMHLCNQLGPPSRVMSWCCTVFKTGPLNNLIKDFAKDTNILTFYGIRQGESVSRSDYQQINSKDFMNLHKTSNIDTSPKIHSQRVVSPIFDWSDIDVWLYIFSNKLDFNDCYRLGYTRVGCWCCPNNSRWSSFLTNIYMPEKSRNWYNFLVGFAKRIGKKDPETYVKTEKWKARQGGAGLTSNQINVNTKPCVDEEFSRTIALSKPINEELYEYMKPFGIISKDMGKKLLNEIFILDRFTNMPILKLQGKIGTYNLKVTAINAENYRLLSQRVDCQIRKYQSCIGCLGCVSVCPQGAIKFSDKKYTISEDKCTGCLECINPWQRGGCLMSKILAVKKGG